jgi:hypothetical protein
MRSTIILLFAACSSICFAQTDSLFVEKIDGTIRGYPISLIDKISFSGDPTSIREQELVKTVFTSFILYQNYPNPFNPNTTIQYTVPQSGDVAINVIDIQGRVIRSLHKSYQQAGTHSFIWDSHTNSGGIAASGTYFCQVLFNGSALVKKLLLLK